MRSAKDLADGLKSDIESGFGKGDMLRLVRQFVMNAERSADVASMISDPPSTTGDKRWDAMVAAVAEYVAVLLHVDVPDWVMESEPLDEWWFVTDYPALHALAFVETPPALARHGVFMRRASLVNV